MAKDNKKRSPVVKPNASTSGLEVEKLNAEIERLKKELKKRKKYGLVWEPKDEEVIEMCKEKLPVLKEVKNKAASVILAHNHPSGDPEPSEDDLLLTKKLVESGKILGIEVFDHIIVVKDGFFSFKNKGII